MDSDNAKLKKGEYKEAWRALFRHLEDYKFLLVLLGVLGIISALANGTVPYIVGLFLDALLDLSRTISIFGFVISVWLGLLILWAFAQLIANLVDWVIDRLGGILGTTIHMDYERKAFAYLLLVPLSFHKNEKIGKLSDHIGKTGWQISNIVEHILIRITPPILSVLVGITVTFFIHPLFTGILVVGIVIYVLILIKIVAPTTDLLAKGHSKWRDSYGDAFQAVSNVESVKNMTMEKHEAEKIGEKYKIAGGLWKKLESIWNNIRFSQRIIVLATQVSIFFMAVYFIQRGELTVGELVALNGYAAMLFGPFVMLGNQWQTLQNGLASIKQSEEKIFQTPAEVYSPQNAFSPERIDGKVEFKNVIFEYNEGVPVLRDLNFEVNKGERVAFVGKSGVGKSTTIDLISAYYFPTKGSVLVDGHDTREFDLTALRSSIAIVPQEPSLFNDTVLMNIKYGKLGATDAEAIEAAKKAHAHEFIEELPKKYNQIVGERGVKLSVGQKQRIAIARAILRNPSILILDEPTSALDAETEKFIAESFEKLMEGRTTFIIAHRLSTVRNTDRILVFEGGVIVEEGKHSDLIKLKDGVYRRLHEYQTGQKD